MPDDLIAMFIDAHCHLQDERLSGLVPDILTRARAARVIACVCCGSAPDDWARVGMLADEHPGVLPAFGVHPWYAASASGDWLDRLARRLADNPGASVGEIGLDHAVKPRADTVQRDAFAAQVALARDLRRPFTVHCREAWAALLDVLRPWAPYPAGFVMHAYSGAPELIRELADMGALFSFAGSITYPGNRRAALTVPAVPEDRLLVETDSPDMLPVGGAPAGTSVADARPLNQLANLPIVAQRLAELRGVTPNAIMTLTTTNASKLWQLNPGSPAI